MYEENSREARQGEADAERAAEAAETFHADNCDCYACEVKFTNGAATAWAGGHQQVAEEPQGGGQAKAGGQFGVNGEWYKGGQFMATSEDGVKGENKWGKHDEKREPMTEEAARQYLADYASRNPEELGDLLSVFDIHAAYAIEEQRNAVAIEAGDEKREDHKMFYLFGWAYGVLNDIASTLVATGRLSDKQLILLDRVASDVVEAIKQGPPEEIDWQEVPIVEGRVKIAGTVLATKWVENDWGGTTKALIHADGDFKIWGTLPCGDRGDQIEFVARIERSDKDAKFGFFTRPTKAIILEEKKDA